MSDVMLYILLNNGYIKDLSEKPSSVPTMAVARFREYRNRAYWTLRTLSQIRISDSANR